MNTAFPNRITQCRQLAGLSKTDLANKLNLSVAAISQWENGTKNPTTDNLVLISRELNIPMQLLLTPIPHEVSCRGPITFRARASVKTGILRRQAQSLAELAAEAFIWLEKRVSIPSAPMPEIAPSEPEESADECRRVWGLGNRPISKLGELFESKGIRLCSASFGDTRFDAFSCILSGRTFVFLGTVKQDRARSRFDAAHELGHLVMHQHYSEEEFEKNAAELEKQANAFAASFLMPAETFSLDVVDASIEGFKRLKPKWGVSIQAMVMRAKDLELISEETYERHVRNMSTQGWRRARGEPLDNFVPEINRSVGKKSMELLTSGNSINLWDIPNELPLPDSILESVFEINLRAMVPKELDNIIVLHRATHLD
ncbi:MAG TPA: XRE family transcriptional regulator [Verrucomicrobiae bacterium]|nr:XRE family transcriptional regulator [Verrucomicrobiae bacterium]